MHFEYQNAKKTLKFNITLIDAIMTLFSTYYFCDHIRPSLLESFEVNDNVC